MCGGGGGHLEGPVEERTIEPGSSRGRSWDPLKKDPETGVSREPLWRASSYFNVAIMMLFFWIHSHSDTEREREREREKERKKERKRALVGDASMICSLSRSCLISCGRKSEECRFEDMLGGQGAKRASSSQSSVEPRMTYPIRRPITANKDLTH